MAEWIKQERVRVIVVFEGVDAAGKGGVIKRITEYVSPRLVRTVAIPVPSDRKRTRWYFQRYIERFPAGGEAVLFDRSWYNRATTCWRWPATTSRRPVRLSGRGQAHHQRPGAPLSGKARGAVE
jgi:hypothetical protein